MATPIGSPARPARTCSSTPTTPSTGIRGGRRRSSGPRRRTSRSSCRSATQRATGATSWSASRSRTRTRRGCSTTASCRSRSIARSDPTSTRSTWTRCQQMTGHGGWPMSVFLTPDGKPFYGGTYFPDSATTRHAVVLSQVLEGVEPGVARAPRRDRAGGHGDWLRQIGESARTLRARPVAGEAGLAGAGPLSGRSTPRCSPWSAASTRANGGWGGAPKFPAADDDRVPAAPPRPHR